MIQLILPKDKFYEYLKNDTFPNANIIIDFEVIFDTAIVDWHYKKLKNIIFKERVVVRNIEINSGLTFVNCEFEKDVIFHNVKSTNFNSTYNDENCSVLFLKCTGTKIIFGNECLFDRCITVNNCKFEKIAFNSTKIVNAGLSIKDSNIDYVDIFNSESDVNLSNSTFLKPLRFESLSGSISLISNEFKGWLKFWNIECRSSFTLNNNKFEDTFDIEGSRINGLFIHGDTFDKKATLENRDVTGANKKAFLYEIYITEAKFTEGFYCNGLGESIKKITLPLTPSFQGLLKFEGWEAGNVYISGVNQNLKLLFKRMFFGFFVINDFTNYSDMSFDKCKGLNNECTFNLLDCDLGATKFNEFSFNTFGAIRIDNATLDRIKPTSNTWFNDEVLQVGNGTQTKQEEFKSKREIYRQIKQALKSNGNQIDSLIFQAKELSAFRGEQKNSKKYDWTDRIIMSVSQSNDYGLNWSKPVIIVFFVTLFLYIILLPYLSDKISYDIAFCPEDIKNTGKAFSSNLNVFWQLFNPIRQMKVTYGDNVSSAWIYFIDLFHRIFLGIMIFQIVKAFRKHVSS